MKYVLKQKPQISDDRSLIVELSKELGISQMTARLLCARGIVTVEAARLFLNPDVSQLNDPFLFRDMRDVVSMIKHTIAVKGKICVYGDYDADGTSACAILYQVLKKMQAKVECFLPDRMEHGYGLSIESIEKLKGTELLLTVDCGITNVAEIARARELGMKTIVTDHHECPPVLPKADFIINPKCPEETYPYHDLCGAGVAFKIAQALLGKDALAYIDLAALATIADIVPLQGENRAIVALGLKKINSDPNPGIAALAALACPKRNEIDAQTVSFVLAPRINAAGRISTARIAFELLSDTNESKLEQLAKQLCELNTDRQKRQEKVVNEAIEMVGDAKDGKIILLYRKDWDIGIVGLAASKVSEAFVRPTVLLGGTETDGVFTGSARSIDGVNIYEALKSQAQFYEKFGGHSGAAGLTIKEDNLKQLASRLNSYMNEHYEDDVFRPVKYYDMEVKTGDIGNKLIEEFDRLRPFGHKNEQVEVLVKRASIRDIRPIGEDKHAKFRIEENKRSVNGVVFGMQAADVPSVADVVGVLNVNSFDNKPQMIVNTFSFDETLKQQYDKAKRYIETCASPSDVDKEIYFCERETLLQVYVILKGVSDQKISFLDEGAMVAFLKKYVDGLSASKIAFGTLVLSQIGLLEIQKSDRIHIMIKNGKRDLLESAIYQKFS
ncbi:MAG: single-stranded-DNA-specific exonuclease RecJ [Christensenella sp.]|uniref:single-stranded-DNA-specific exonuclease RecJ n=1 Tax=Christensenella sp. TaxID=1935934 RepID=UPI002B2132C2|nr:single-stranded-DNA-specific exonuclease RecJ [Christensenella sp.]MEA5003967.1 single-stranded-DNA-specific exonuclease RecJ [Christensenella sp.]